MNSCLQVTSLRMEDTDATRISDTEKSLIEGLFRSEIEEVDAESHEKVPLGVGYPSKQLVDEVSKIMKVACEERLAEEAVTGNHLLHYGLRMGDPLLRKELAKFLCRHYGYEVSSKDLLITTGATFGLHHLCSAFFDTGDIVFVEEPSYFIALTMMEEMGRRIVHVPFDENGIVTSELEKMLQMFYPKDGFVPSKQKLYWSMLYLIPCFQNPTGCCTSEERCKEVVRLARKYRLLVVCDDLYGALRWGPDTAGRKLAMAQKRLKYFDKEDDPDFFGNVVSNNSFSKILSPGLRCGWIEAPPVVLAKFVGSGLLYSGGSFAQFGSGFVGKALELGLVDDHLLNVCNDYRDKVECIQQILDKDLNGIIKYRVPQGGFFIWIQLPDTMDCETLAELCNKKYNVSFAKGTSFTKNEGKLTNFIRISFSYCEKDKLISGVRELAAAILEMHGENSS